MGNRERLGPLARPRSLGSKYDYVSHLSAVQGIESWLIGVPKAIFVNLDGKWRSNSSEKLYRKREPICKILGNLTEVEFSIQPLHSAEFIAQTQWFRPQALPQPTQIKLSQRLSLNVSGRHSGEIRQAS